MARETNGVKTLGKGPYEKLKSVCILYLVEIIWIVYLVEIVWDVWIVRVLTTV